MLVRRRLRADSVQLLHDQVALPVCPVVNRRAAADLRVLLRHLRSTSPGDPRTEDARLRGERWVYCDVQKKSYHSLPLHGQLDDVRISEEAMKERLHFVQAPWAAHVHH